MEGDSIAQRMLAFINTWPERPMAIGLGALPKDAPGMMMRQLSAAVKEKVFIDGSYLGRWPFAVFVRTDGKDTRGRLDAGALLHALAEWMEAAELPELFGDKKAIRVEMTQLPAVAAAFNSGAEDTMAVFSLQYKEGMGHE